MHSPFAFLKALNELLDKKRHWPSTSHTETHLLLPREADRRIEVHTGKHLQHLIDLLDTPAINENRKQNTQVSLLGRLVRVRIIQVKERSEDLAAG